MDRCCSHNRGHFNFAIKTRLPNENFKHFHPYRIKEFQIILSNKIMSDFKRRHDMSDFTVNIFQQRGSSYQNGLRLGREVNGTRIPQTFEMITRPEIDTDNLKAIYRSFAPHLLDELEGLADGMEIPWSRAAALFSGYDVPRPIALGCSAMLTDAYYVRNYDFSPELYDSYFSLIQPAKAF